MTTPSHTLLALAVAIPTDSCSWPVKAITLVGLTLSHLPTDMFPHYHLYGFGKLKKNWFGAILELGGGLIILPLVVWQLAHIDPWWLIACMVAASLFDFLVAAKIPVVVKLNHWAHQWEHDGKMPVSEKVRYEIVQIFALLSILYTVIAWYHY